VYRCSIEKHTDEFNEKIEKYMETMCFSPDFPEESKKKDTEIGGVTIFTYHGNIMK
jgi:hypothetical protein